MSILHWDPLEDFDAVRREMSRFVDAGLSPLRFGRMGRAEGRGLRLPLDVYSTAEELVITAAVPGLDPDDLELTIEGTTLTIHGEFRAPIENVDYLLQERPYGEFGRSLTINVPFDADSVEAKFDKGLLTIIVPKADVAKPKVIEVKTE